MASSVKRFISILILAVGLLGCGSPVGDEPKKVEDAIPTASAWTWGYFFAAADKASVESLAVKHKSTLNRYRVDKVVSIKGQPGVDVKAGSNIVRMETAARLPEGKWATLLLHGLPQHLQYTSMEQRDDLNRRARPELPPGKDTVAVVIPIRKTAAWWAMPHDERQAHFKKKAAAVGHTAIGADYVERIHRKLYHTRYAVETTDHDFVTYFEFDRAHEDDFKSLCSKLRDPVGNPEWNFVDREYEIWMTKLD